MPARAGVQGIHKVILATLAEESKNLVDAFYEIFLNDPRGSRYLTHRQVNQRLRHVLERWLFDLFEHYPPIIDSESQRSLGEAHARLGVPMDLVLRGAACLRSGLSRRLAEQMNDAKELGEALTTVSQAFDNAIIEMSEAYVSGARMRARTAESYRLFSLGRDVAIEREAQRAALMEWSQSILFGLLAGDRDFPPLSDSEFGLWFRHRASILFDEAPEFPRIQAAMNEIDRNILPLARTVSAGDMPQLAARFQKEVDEVKFLLGEMFQQIAGVDQGTDPLTRTLNRRFLSTVLSREIVTASAAQSFFSICMIDVDHFKDINDRFGHPAGDAVLKQIAGRIQDNIRPSDFIFRYGGEEFLVLLVEAEEHEAMQVAERIRSAVEATPVDVQGAQELTVTVSIGVATYDGHPDYQTLVERADRALYQAKRLGRNQVVAG